MEFKPDSPEIQARQTKTVDLLRDKKLVLAVGNPLTLAALSLISAIRRSSVGNFTTESEALLAIQKHKPDLLITTDGLAQGNGIHLITATRDLSPSTKSVLFTQRETQDVVRDAINAHTSGVVFESSIGKGKDADFMHALGAALDGSTYYPPEVREKAGFDLKALPDFSEKEFDVLRELCLGLSNKEIATRLVVSPETVKTHVSNVISKFGVKDRTAAVIQAIRAGL